MASKRSTQMWRDVISKASEPWRNERLQELKAAFLLGSNIADACRYALIAESTYYHWMKKYPKLLEEIDKVRLHPIIIAQRTLMKGLENDSKLAFEYLKAKRPNDYAGAKQKVEVSTKTEDREPADPRAAAAVREAVSEALRKLNVEANRE